MNQSHKTAIKRNKLSTPMKYLKERGLLTGKMLDYGSGFGNDAQLIGMEQYDKHYQPIYPKGRQFDRITCNYVLNVATGSEQVEILTNIHELLTTDGSAYISVRNDLKMPKQKGRGCIQVQVHLTLPIVTQNSNFRMYRMTKNSY